MGQERGSHSPSGVEHLFQHATCGLGAVFKVTFLSNRHSHCIKKKKKEENKCLNSYLYLGIKHHFKDASWKGEAYDPWPVV